MLSKQPQLPIHCLYKVSQVFCAEVRTTSQQIDLMQVVMFKEYSLEIRVELPQTKVADNQPSPRAGRPEGLGKAYLPLFLPLTCLGGRYEAHTDFTKVL